MSDYYVANGGDDNAAGSEAEPWETTAKVNATAFAPGDRIYFNRGDTWSGSRLCIPTSGMSGNVTKYLAYGSGANPIIDASKRFTDWTLHEAAIWKRTKNNDPLVVFEDGVRLIHAANYGAMVQGSYYYDGAADLCYVWCTDDGNPNTGHDTAHPDPWQACIDMNGKEYLEFDSIDVKRSARDGIDFSSVNGSDHVTVSNCEVSWNGYRGVDCGGGAGITNLNSITFENVESHDNNGEGFWCGNGSDQVLEDCEVYNSGKDRVNKGYSGDGGGIMFGTNAVDGRATRCHVHDIYWGYAMKTEWEAGGDAALRTVIERCKLEGGGSHSTVWLMGTDTVFKNNLVIEEGHEAIQIQTPSSGECIYHNTVIQKTTVKWCFYCVSGTNLKIKNNVCYGDVAEMRIIGVWSGCQSGLEVDYNCYYGTTGYRYYWEGGGWRTSIADWRTDSSQDANSSEADPLFVNLGGGDYSLQGGSPARNEGVGVGVADDYDGNGRPQGAGYDMGAFEYIEAVNVHGKPMSMAMDMIQQGWR